MSDRKLVKAVQALLKQARKFQRKMTKALAAWLLRSTLNIQRQRHRSPIAGFVLPTTVLLILVVTLTTGALSYRAFSSSQRSIQETKSRIIYNAATPAIDRARAKLEYLFDSNKDGRLPSGVPSEEILMTMLLNQDPPAEIKGVQGRDPVESANGKDYYTLPDEEEMGGRLDINGDGKVDNAWAFRTDSDGDGAKDTTVVYSIIFSTPHKQPGAASNPEGWQRLVAMTDEEKAAGEDDILSSGVNRRKLSYVRNSPLSNATGTNCGRGSGATLTAVEAGWYLDEVSTSTLRKTFQVDAFAVPDSAASGVDNFATLEFQQDRILNRGNKWGAWFRNDLEIHPGPPFNWNGAMHTEGSLIIGTDQFSAYLISSPNSCLFYKDASEISVTSTTDPDTGAPFKGIVASGLMKDNSTVGGADIHAQQGNTYKVGNILNSGATWTSGGFSPVASSLDPMVLQERNGYQARSRTDGNTGIFVNKENTFLGRIVSDDATAPYVDDTYRADNLYGPKRRYDGSLTIPLGRKSGQEIRPGDFPDPRDYDRLTALSGADASAVGLDGYWERRARNEGLRVLVGQRLELGNSNGWAAPRERSGSIPAMGANQTVVNQWLAGSPPATPPKLDKIDFRKSDFGSINAQNATDMEQADFFFSDAEGDPLYPPYQSPLPHQIKQRRAQRDNLAAVQATAIYHAAVSRDYPVACMSSTSHPGTPFTLRQSINFLPTFIVDSGDPVAGGGGLDGRSEIAMLSNFFLGQGTNGWEFEPPLRTEPQFKNELSPNQPLRRALDNLAQFAGDHNANRNVDGKPVTGAFPPTQEAGQVHPDPEFSLWGNFSNLRRALANYDRLGYDALSPADKTYLQTASCTIGMLAYTIDRTQRFDPRNVNNDRSPTYGNNVMIQLAQALYRLMDGNIKNGEVLPPERLRTYGYKYKAEEVDWQPENYDPRDYDNVPAEAYIAALRNQLVKDAAAGANVVNDNTSNYKLVRLAEAILTHFQVRRDRTYGFRPSAAANTWNYNPYVVPQFFGQGKTTLWSSACDPNLFALNLAPPTGKQGAETGAGQVLLYRLTLSRLCGTVIPPGAVRETSGDPNYPARNAISNPDYTKYLPMSGTSFEETVPQGADPTLNPDADSLYQSSTSIASKIRTAFDSQVTSTIFGSVDTTGEIYRRATVQPKWPSLYYLFPEFEHDHDGAVETIGGNCIDHRQPDGNLRSLAACAPAGAVLPAAFQPWAEPYITDAYINQVNTIDQAVVYKPVDDLDMRELNAADYGDDGDGYEVALPGGRIYEVVNGETKPLNLTYKSFGYLVPDKAVSAVVVRPRKLPASAGFTNPIAFANEEISGEQPQDWKLPIQKLPASAPAQNTPPNRIRVPVGNTTVETAIVPFLDRVLMDGREWLPSRVLDFDLGLLRRTRPDPAEQINKTFDGWAKNDVWLPQSGIVYAFREDAVREDAINRPAAAATSQSNATNANPSLQADPAVTSDGISRKPVDFVPDPDRRTHGFRLRNGSQLKRHASMGLESKFNIRGLSLFSDSPVYIMGYYNLHQKGEEDTNNPATGENRLEEFTQQLPLGTYNTTQFYNDRTTRDPDFPNPDVNRWRPSEILADSINLLSNNFCDGSIQDAFMNPERGGSPSVDARVYNDLNSGLFGPGCTNSGRTSFLNQNLPNKALPSTPGVGSGAATPWDWHRENLIDLFSPVVVGRNGNGMIQPPRITSNGAKPLVAEDYTTFFAPTTPTTAYYRADEARGLQTAVPTRVNSIIVSGIVPSRLNQGYGGMHNFPRFNENWGNVPLWFAGSFLQLSFSNYATAPQDQDVWESGANATTTEVIRFYSAPDRLWGYDVALQQFPAGPAAARFVTASKERNEFYEEPPASDPYISNLCRAIADKRKSDGTPILAIDRCPTP
jgi:type II secretory pathway pseudopilin PulG